MSSMSAFRSMPAAAPCPQQQPCIWNAPSPNFVIHEHHTYALSPYNKELCIHDYQPVNGKFSVPDLPGLGNELSEVAFRNCDRVTIQ